jgi:hypothetical protein
MRRRRRTGAAARQRVRKSRKPTFKAGVS